MTLGVPQLLDLRRMRERQAESDLSRAMAEHRQQLEHIANLERSQAEFAITSALRVTALYQGVVDARLGPSGLDQLIALVDEQYRLRHERKVEIATQKRVAEQLAQAVDEARTRLNERRRNVAKLEHIDGEARREAARMDEIRAEADMERPAPVAREVRYG